MNRRISILLLVATVSLCSYSQTLDCISDQYLQSLIQLYPSIADEISTSLNKTNSSFVPVDNDAIIYIPVVVHIVSTYNNSEVATITDAQVTSQINILNEAYSNLNGTGVDTKIRFCLAKRTPTGLASTGITRHSSTKTIFTYVDDKNDNNMQNDELLDDEDIKSYDPWPSGNYLNIWVTAMQYGAGTYSQNFIVKGYSSFPFSTFDPSTNIRDGIVMNYKFFGNMGTADLTNFNQGKTLVHETGHWCGLWHTFQGECSTPNNDCHLDGDQVCDTDPMELAFKATNPSNCSIRLKCGGLSVSAENYMDYNFDQCRKFFTQGQKDRARFILSKYRSNIYSLSITNPGVLPIGCTPSVYSPGGGGASSYPCPPLSPNNLHIGQDGFWINGWNVSQINICLADGVNINFTHDGECIFLPSCTSSIPCNQDPYCNWISQLTGACDCEETYILYWISIYYNCDENWNCSNETGKWFHADSRSSPINVGSALNFNFQKGGRYKVKLAVDNNCPSGGDGWEESVKNIFIVPDDDIYLANVNLTSGPDFDFNPPHPYPPYPDFPVSHLINKNITVENITTENDFFLGNNVLLEATQSITILPNTIITGNFTAKIIDDADCAEPLGRMANPDSLSSHKTNTSTTKSKRGVTGQQPANSSSQNSNNNSQKTKNSQLPTPNSQLFSLYPNPNNGTMQMDYRLQEGENGELLIYDITGRRIKRVMLNSEASPSPLERDGVRSLQIQNSELKDGVYPYHVVVNGEIMVSEKLVIIK